MSPTRLLALAPLALVLGVLLGPADAEAIPAFARRYRVSCTTCHEPFPRLKPFGDAFAARGFALEPGQEPARASLDLGDDLLSLPRDFPVAARIDGFAQVSDRDPRLDFEAPWIAKLLFGGRIAEGVAFYTYFIIEEGEVVGLEDAYVQLAAPLGLPVNVLFGQFQLCDPIAKRELRLERLDYEALRARVGLSTIDLTYDRGVALASGLGPVSAILTVTNGSGIGAGAPFDGDRFKNFSLDLSADLGVVRVGAFGFYGKQDGSALDPAAGATPGEVNTTWMLSPRVLVPVGEQLDLAAVYLERRDSNPAFAGAGARELETRGGFAEAVVYPAGRNGRWALAGLYNRVDSDDDAADRESFAAHASFLYRRNVRLVAEVDRDVREGAWTGSVGTVLAF